MGKFSSDIFIRSGAASISFSKWVRSSVSASLPFFSKISLPRCCWGVKSNTAFACASQKLDVCETITGNWVAFAAARSVISCLYSGVFRGFSAATGGNVSSRRPDLVRYVCGTEIPRSILEITSSK